MPNGNSLGVNGLLVHGSLAHLQIFGDRGNRYTFAVADLDE
ncbi:hypothetical protein APA_447 [Pseudanabaena sp. lw0831]|nr:hypothetical protein APA_447 [Pseudanabaena sp. lw0831]